MRRVNLGLVLLLGLAGCGPPPAPSRSPAPDLVIAGVGVVDVEAGRVSPPSDVVIAGDRIVSVSAAGAVPVSATVPRIDGRGRYLVPGLWDMHTHSLWSTEAVATFLPAYVANGVTGIRDMGGDLAVLAAVRDSLRTGTARLPRVFAAGLVLDGPAPVDPSISLAVADSSAARRAVAQLRASGADFLKVYTLLPRAAYFAIVATAREAGLAVAGHVPAEVTAVEAAESGQRSIEHLNDELEPYCTPATSEQCLPVLAAFARYHTAQVPTLVALRMKAHADDSAYVTDARLRYIPRGLRAAWLAERTSKLARGAAYFSGKRQRYADELWLVGELHRGRVPLLAGSDAGVAFSFPGFSLHDELELLVQAGLTPREALQAATTGAARFLGASDSLGEVAPGMSADLMLLRGNPLEDIRQTRSIEAVLLRGRVLSRSALDTLLESVAAAAGR